MRNKHRQLTEKMLKYTLVTKSHNVKIHCAMFIQCFLGIKFDDRPVISLEHVTCII